MSVISRLFPADPQLERVAALEAALSEARARLGDWTTAVPVGEGVFTRPPATVPNSRLRKVVHAAQLAVNKPLSACRVLDLGCLEGVIAVEFALHGATVVGVEGRADSAARAEVARDLLGLDRLNFVCADVREVNEARFGRFDLILCCGLLYQLDGRGVIDLLTRLAPMCEGGGLVIDTHVALRPEVLFKHEGRTYSGLRFVEHAEGDSREVQLGRRWASIGNTTSFWPTRAGLTNLLIDAGFSSVVELLAPAMELAQPSQVPNQERAVFVARSLALPVLATSPAPIEAARLRDVTG
jgi:SAM-dependent methyltransferase